MTRLSAAWLTKLEIGKQEAGSSTSLTGLARVIRSRVLPASCAAEMHQVRARSSDLHGADATSRLRRRRPKTDRMADLKKRN